jgi:hypothetical protein
MESGKRAGTVVLNLMDGTERFFELTPDKAVVAAFEVFNNGGYLRGGFLDPPTHPSFKVHHLGYSCGDWIAYKDNRIMEIH